MYRYLEKLAQIGSEPLGGVLDLEEVSRMIQMDGSNKHELIYLLGLKNGFYAFESALHVLPYWGQSPTDQEIIRWNEPSLWRSLYGEGTAQMFFFAEDLFGCQFYCNSEEVGRFDPETGDSEHLSRTLEDWADLVLTDYAVQTGYKIARQWQAAHGPLRPGNRLVPIYPFVTSQGSYDLSNLYEIDSLEGLRSRAEFAAAIKNLPDGAKIKITPIDLPNLPA